MPSRNTFETIQDQSPQIRLRAGSNNLLHQQTKSHGY